MHYFFSFVWNICSSTNNNSISTNVVQIGANMLNIARVVMQSSKELKATDISKAVIGIDKAEELLSNSIRFVLRFHFSIVIRRTALGSYTQAKF